MIVRQSFLIVLLLIASCGGDQPKKTVVDQLDSVKYYETYNGHEVSHLQTVYRGLKNTGCQQFVFHAGDSSLDNKAWVNSKEPAVNGYEQILNPPQMVADVDYWLNRILAEETQGKVCSIMTAIEGSTLAQRENSLLPQDKFLQQHITDNDYLIVSVGGNDIALSPNEVTQRALQALKNDPQDAQAFAYILSIMGEKTKKYIEKLVEKNMPKKIIVSMIYYPDEADVSSWSHNTLTAFDYSNNPRKLQSIIDKLFLQGTKKIAITGAQIAPLALFEVLNGKTSADYVSRVEPSKQGGKKMATRFIDELLHR